MQFPVAWVCDILSSLGTFPACSERSMWLGEQHLKAGPSFLPHTYSRWEKPIGNMAEWASQVEWSSYSFISQALQSGMRCIWTHAVQVCVSLDMCAHKRASVGCILPTGHGRTAQSDHRGSGEKPLLPFSLPNKGQEVGDMVGIGLWPWGGRTLPLCKIYRKWNPTQ